MTKANGDLVAGSVSRYTPFGDWRTEPTAALTDIGYTGHRHNNLADNDLGLVYMQARYYMPELGRFASADTIVPDAEDPHSLNRYAYVRNNPLAYVDPSGHCWGFASGLQNTFYQTTCQNLEAAWTIVEHPNASAGAKVLAGSYILVEAAAHLIAVGGTGVAAVGCLTGAGTVICTGAGAAVTAASADGDPTNELSATSRLIPELGQKLNYLFGKATGAKHNVARSHDMFYKLRNIGLNDTSGWRDYVSQHLGNVLNDPNNIVRVQENGRIVRESLLWGPLGAVKLETIWEAEKLITFYVYSSK